MPRIIWNKREMVRDMGLGKVYRKWGKKDRKDRKDRRIYGVKMGHRQEIRK